LLAGVPLELAELSLVYKNSRGAWRLLTDSRASEMWRSLTAIKISLPHFFHSACDEVRSSWDYLSITERKRRLAALKSALNDITEAIEGTPFEEHPVGWYRDDISGAAIDELEKFSLPRNIKSVSRITLRMAFAELKNRLSQPSLLHVIDRDDRSQEGM
jgi:hypothetical protein